MEGRKEKEEPQKDRKRERARREREVHAGKAVEIFLDRREGCEEEKREVEFG